MFRTTRKLTHQDFRQRIARVDSHFYETGDCASTKTPAARPIKAVLAGCFWAFAILTIANNRMEIETAMRDRNLDPQYHNWILAGLAALIAVSMIMLVVHALRALFQKAAKRGNSGGFLVGAGLALALSYTPASVWVAGSEIFNNNIRGLIISTSASLEIDMPKVDFSDLAFVTSAGQ